MGLLLEMRKGNMGPNPIKLKLFPLIPQKSWAVLQIYTAVFPYMKVNFLSKNSVLQLNTRLYIIMKLTALLGMSASNYTS